MLKYTNILSKISFIWSDDYKKVKLNIPIIEQKTDMKYRLYFKEPFVDIENNQSQKDKYIVMSNPNFFTETEFLENIVFEIAGSK